MKRISILTLMALTAGTMLAEGRSLAEAQAIAQQHLSELTGRTVTLGTMQRAARRGAQTAETAEAAKVVPYYAFNDAENEAFVVVSGSTLTRPVLAYGMGQLPTDIDPEDESLPEGLAWWLKAIDERTAWLEAHPEDAQTEAQLQAKAEAVAPLMNGLAWDQGEPYNLQTPVIGNNHCPTGCAATAMAQVIRYHRYPTQGKGSHSYKWSYMLNGSLTTRTLSVNYAQQTYNYDKMPLVINRNNPASEAEKQEVAKLMYHCGVSIDMEYAADGSGALAYRINRALVENFGYNSRTIDINREGYSYDQWKDIMQGELRAGRPVIYGGNSGLDPESGHAFVLEGFDADGLYYVNWGWSGNYNAYYDIAVLNPSGTGTGARMMDDGFCENQMAIVNISPTEGAGTVRSALCGGSENSITSSRGSATKGSTITVKGRSVFNYSSMKVTGDYGLVLMKGNTVVNQTKFKSITLDAADDNITGFNIQNNYTIPSDLSDGTYQAYFYFQPSGESEWDIIRFPRVSNETYLKMEVSGNNVTITRPALQRDITASNWSFDTTPLATRNETVTMQLTNNGDETLVGEFRWQLTTPDGTKTNASFKKMCTVIAPKQSVTGAVSYSFKQSGQWSARLYFKPWNVEAETWDLIEGCDCTFTVEADYQAGAILSLNEAPTLTSGSEDGKFYRNSPIEATLNLTNTGVDYDGRFAIYLYSKSSNPSNLTPVASYEGEGAVKGDSKAHNVILNFTFDLSNLTKNVSYYARPYYYNGSEWVLISENLYAKVNIYGKDEPSGIAEVTVDDTTDELRAGMVIYNVLGRSMVVPADGQLPKGIYIVGGKKRVIK